MTDLSKYTLAKLEELKRINTPWLDAYTKQSEAIDAEIERRKAEPDYAAWEPKWQAFREAMGWDDWTQDLTRGAVRALIAAHNTPLAGEGGWTEYQPSEECVGPAGVSPKTHEIEVSDNFGRWIRLTIEPSWNCSLYRYRPKQTDEVRP